MVDRIVIESRIFSIKYPEKVKMYFSGQLVRGGFLNDGVYCESKNSYFHVEDDYGNYQILIQIMNSNKNDMVKPPIYLVIPFTRTVTPVEILNVERDKETDCIVLCVRYLPSQEAMRYAVNRYRERGVLHPVMEAEQ